MTDNARIVREALMAYYQADEDGVMVTVSRQAIHEADGLIDSLETELATAKADLERALVAIQKHKDRYIFANPDFEDYELWKVLDRAALAPEQKG